MKEWNFNVRATAEQRKLFERAADLRRRTFSDWVRITLEDAAKAAIAEAEPKPEPVKPSRSKRK